MVADISCVSLRLTDLGDEEGVILLRTTDALRLCGEAGYETLPAYRALARVSRLGRREASAIRVLVSGAGLARASLVNLDDQSLYALLRGKLRTGELAMIRDGGGVGGDGSDSDLEQRRLVREIEAKAQRRLSYAGRQYRLVVDANLRRLPNRDSYEVVSNRDAVQILRGLADQGLGDSDSSKLLARAAELLTQDWRPPKNPDGLVLLRRIVVQAPYAPAQGPALTPSQLKKLAKNDWIEIEAVDQDGEPYAGHYKLQLADQSLREGEFDEQGFLGVHEIESGTCTLDIGEVKEPAAEPDVGEGDVARDEEAVTAESEASAEPELPDVGPAEDESYEVPDLADEAEAAETKPIFLRLHMDPDKVASLKEEFRLFSTDGSYSATEATDRIKGNAYMDLMFDEAPTNLSYSLEISGPGIKPYLVFEDVPFANLKGFH